MSIHDSVVQTDTFGQTAEGQAAGTGFVLTEDGYIVTNNHVVEGATDITVDFSDGSNAAATVVAADPNSDLAVLKVDETGLTPIELGSSSSLQVGDQLVAVGNALDLSGVTDREIARDLEVEAAANVKRVWSAPGAEPDWTADPDPRRILAFTEVKTVWHPIGV